MRYALSLGLTSLLCGACNLGDTSLGEFEGSSSTADPQADSGAATMEEAAEDGSSGTMGDSSAESSTGEAVVCGERSPCSIPLDASGFDFGALDSSFDVDGCPRPVCFGPEDCEDNEVCFDPSQWGSANGVTACGDDPEAGICDCFVELSGDGDDYCLPAEEVGEASNGDEYCAQFEDADSCGGTLENLSSGGCGWVEGFSASADATCEELVPLERCVFLREFGPAAKENTCADNARLPVVRDTDEGREFLLVPADSYPGATPTDDYFECVLLPDPSICECACGD